jgi:shikimate dehydrogenase
MEFAILTFSENTAQYRLIGNPVRHSLSPFIMNHAFRMHDIDANYAACAVTTEQLPDMFRQLIASGVTGMNVTYPLKTAVLEWTDLCSPAVTVIGAANTLVIRNGQVAAHNTDASGTVRALADIAGLRVAGKRIFIFGGGAAARAAAYGLLHAGARAVTLGVRDTARVEDVMDPLRRAFAGGSLRVVALDDIKHTDALRAADIVINATPAGMIGQSTRLVFDETAVSERQCAFEFVYQPPQTDFLETTGRRGAKSVSGVALLVSQARESFKLWTNRAFDVKAVYERTIASMALSQPDERRAP